MRSLFKKQPPIGLSIQAHSIQLIELNKKAIIHPFPESRNPDSSLLDTNQLTTMINTIWATAGLTNRHVALHIPHHLVKEETICVPLHLTEEEITSEIHAHLAAHYPALLDNIVFDYVREPNQRKQQDYVRIACAKKTYRDDLLQSIQNANLIVDFIDIETDALHRAFRFISHHKQMPNINAILSLTPHHALLMILKDAHHALIEETKWHQNSAQLMHFLQLIANTRPHIPLHLLLTGHTPSIQQLQEDEQTSPLIHFYSANHLLPQSAASGQLTNDSELFIAFGLAIRALDKKE